MDTAYCVVVFWAVAVSVMFYIVLQDGFRLLDERNVEKLELNRSYANCSGLQKSLHELAEQYGELRVERDGLLVEITKLRASKAAVIADAQGKLCQLSNLADTLVDEFDYQWDDSLELDDDEELEDDSDLDYEDDEDSDLDYCDDDALEENE